MKYILFILFNWVAAADTLEFIQFRKVVANIESSNNPKAIGDNGKSIGIYQISKQCFVDAQQADHKLLNYKYTDCFDPNISDLVFCAYSKKYCCRNVQNILNGKNTMKDFEIIARTWNGGPKGPSKKATEGYWQRIKKSLTARRR